ncbi:MAG: glycoside hydrolase family 88 protein [Bacteroidaceae bacterium]|nr:glycoside hydrolase family 88 protein [Bacteroidaceae bacterium]
MKTRNMALLLLALLTVQCTKQQKTEEEVNDMTTPLHLLKPDYKIPYGEVDKMDVKNAIDRIFQYVDAQTPHALKEDGTLERGAFRIGSYEWGITYQALLAAAEVTGEQKYSDYVKTRFDFIAEVAPKFSGQEKCEDAQMEQILHPRALDDCGTMCTAMMKFEKMRSGDNEVMSNPLSTLIENYFQFVENGQYRLPDRTFARHRPQRNTIWLDDMYMGIPTIAYRGVYTGDAKYFDEAATMYKYFVQRMWVPEKGIYRHGYVEGLADQPTYHWARANGWALLTTVELLDMLPESHPDRPFIIEQLRKHVRGLASYQSSEGFWHQLLDRSDSYLETSATAIYTYSIARAINQGWLEGITYGPVAQLGWNAVASKITEEGLVAGTCVGTGMAFDPAFYYYRPVSAAAAHGYGPAIWAAAEMLRLLDNWHPRTNDSGLHYYEQEQTNESPLFYLTEDGKGEAVK